MELHAWPSDDAGQPVLLCAGTLDVASLAPGPDEKGRSRSALVEVKLQHKPHDVALVVYEKPTAQTVVN